MLFLRGFKKLYKLLYSLFQQSTGFEFRSLRSGNLNFFSGCRVAAFTSGAFCNGEWGEISLDFENGTAEIIRLADWDTMKTNRFANKEIVYLLNCENEKLPKETIVAAEL